jgi:hypothetical protein
MLDSRCARAFAAGGVQVLGTWLPGFTLWHAFWLEIIRSPLFCGETTPTFDDLAVAVRVCATPIGTRPDFSPPGFFARRRLDRFKAACAAEMDRFGEWIVDHMTGPDCWHGEDGGELKSPWPLYLVARLVFAPGDFAHTRAQAWATSPGQARWLLSAICEAQGGDPRIITDQDNDALREAEAAEREEADDA